MSQRTDRLDSQIQQELMQLLQREMKDPRIGFATITRVETAGDSAPTLLGGHGDGICARRWGRQAARRRSRRSET